MFYFHPENWGLMIQFDYSNIFQMGWLKPPTSCGVLT